MFSFSRRSASSTALIVASFASLALGALGACGSSTNDGGGGSAATTSTTGATGGAGGATVACEGGVVIDGVCEAKCTDDKCAPGNVCVDNRCKRTCSTHLDCNAGQGCAVAPREGGGEIAVCQASGKAAGIGTSCPFGSECDGMLACPNGGACDPSACGGKPDECKLDVAACKREEGCTKGRCAGDDSACTVTTCAASECKPLACRTTGAGDADAYCTVADCEADADCAPGYGCGIVRDPHAICGASPAKPKDGLEPCIDPANYAANGATYREGPISLLRNMCLKRDQCATCETDLDCSALATASQSGKLEPTQRCIDIAGSKRCARNCATSNDCDPDARCTEGSCVPKFEGGCVGTGKFCEPCKNDVECGGTADNSMMCGSLSGNQRACIDGALPDACPGGSSKECPKSPSGKSGVCLGEAHGLQPSDGAYHRCYFPFRASTSKFGCW
jgi:hypothetical protein